MRDYLILVKLCYPLKFIFTEQHLNQIICYVVAQEKSMMEGRH
jgi:hypothetical protein